MSNPYFSFKRFTVWHDRCAMKAGTDSVILGAYVSCDGVVRRILDVGAGCGILSLMMAQRFPEAEITGVEIDVEAACQARENAAASEWAGRIRMENCDFRLFEDECRFDLIVSNPPYIPLSQKEGLQIEVKDFEPASALFTADEKGLEFYEKITKENEVKT